MKQQLILVLNCGSSSIKFAVIDGQSHHRLLQGLVEEVGQPNAVLHYEFNGQKNQQPLADLNFNQAMTKIVELIKQQADIDASIMGVGHRVVHGGEHFVNSVMIDETIIAKIKECVSLAPLHNPANLLGIELAQQAFPHLSHVAVFDTAFHQTMPVHAYLYPLPQRFYRELKIRRYGFHGTSHRYVAGKAATQLNQSLTSINLISDHLGNGCSLAAIAQGKSIDTTLGLTPLEGLMMGTRCGDIDPSIPTLLIEQHGLSAAEVTDTLNRQSGLLGVSELSNDMRTLTEQAEAGHQQAKLAIDLFCYRLAKQIAALWVPLATVDALVFTGGIGENAISIRRQVLEHLVCLGFKIDDQRNHHPDASGLISADDSPVAMVVSTDEEAMIAQDTLLLIT